jgi:hypothetical protein
VGIITIVPGGGDDERAFSPGVVDRILLRLGVTVASERDIADERSVIGGVDDRLRKVAFVAVSTGVDDAQRHHLRIETVPGDADRVVVGGRGRDTGHVRPVAENVPGVGRNGAVNDRNVETPVEFAAVGDGRAGPPGQDEVRVVIIDTAIDDRDPHRSVCAVSGGGVIARPDAPPVHAVDQVGVPLEPGGVGRIDRGVGV